MARCNWCLQDMTNINVIGCAGNRVVDYPDSTRLPAIPYGEEERYGDDWDSERRCHDCNVASGGSHHPGCDVEECPKCHGQLISCGCLDEEDEEEE